jgi:putative spermidine/putrescine transport system permease protein
MLRFSFSVIAILFLVAPLIAIMPLGFNSSVILTYPIQSWSLRWMEELFTAAAWQRAIVNSFLIGAGTTFLSLVLGTLAALGLRNRRILFKDAIRMLFLLPMVIPAVVLGVGMQILLARFGLSNSYAGVIIAHTVVAVPFVVISVGGSLSGIDERLELAAESLGASPVTVFRRITLPLAMPGIVSGGILAFATSLDEVVLTLFVAGPNQRTLAREMFSSLKENLSPAIAAAAFLFIFATLLVSALVFAMQYWQNLRMRKG